MPNKARVAIKVFDVETSIAFYTTFLDFELVEFQPDAGIAYIRDSDHDLLLLAPPHLEDPRSLLDEPSIVFKPGDTLDFVVDTFETQHARLVEDGHGDMRVEENERGERKLRVTDPNGYHFVFVIPVKRSPETLRAAYAGLSDEIAAALDGLTEADLDLERAPNEWSIRQIIHHLALSTSLSLMPIETVLVNPGNVVVRPPYDQEKWVEMLDYQHRPIGTSLALIRAVQAHITQLLLHVPNNWDHAIVSKFTTEDEGRTTTLSDMIAIQIGHTTAHLDEIRQTRKVHHR
ncbi:DinB family protein [Ktedonobacter racemifer]|uniref:Glyoxalase/bleomycin resistance protein/dioxygenase n=1 Tax=Ktedonobacter racemifer DSM 44963 TaxID=485913 RepID=D6U786_KTERA|nr:DinB family protein [Ktedonobacter racemifer]EFH79747.1 Glyoxalase/bleomycin resistance protein/dioxygenase [Ktedonobacter racemifer DSM 44963]